MCMSTQWWPPCSPNRRVFKFSIGSRVQSHPRNRNSCISRFLFQLFGTLRASCLSCCTLLQHQDYWMVSEQPAKIQVCSCMLHTMNDNIQYIVYKQHLACKLCAGTQCTAVHDDIFNAGNWTQPKLIFCWRLARYLFPNRQDVDLYAANSSVFKRQILIA